MKETKNETELNLADSETLLVINRNCNQLEPYLLSFCSTNSSAVKNGGVFKLANHHNSSFNDSIPPVFKPRLKPQRKKL